MNEKLINQILEIEKKATKVVDAATEEAARIPLLAEKEAQVALENARSEAEKEAARLVVKAKNGDESSTILSTAQESIQRDENLAKSNLNRAVAYVLARVIGREQS